MTLEILVLGGTSEGRMLAERLAHDARYRALLSYAGRTARIAAPAVPHRIGGFGGVDGLHAFLRAGNVGALIDATHAFAARMSHNAVLAARAAGVPLLRLEPPPWTQQPGDRWQHVSDMRQAAEVLQAQSRRRVWLTIGRLEIGAFAIAPQHHYMVRAIDDFALPLPDARLLLARGPFALDAERTLLAHEAIDVVVSKNAGTPSTYAKLQAARELGVQVIMVQRPELLPAETVTSIDDALAWLARVHDGTAARRRE